jgi:hypothetical protein
LIQYSIQNLNLSGLRDFFFVNDDSDSEDEVYVPAKETSKDSDDEVEFVRSRTVEERNAEGFKNAIVIDE